MFARPLRALDGCILYLPHRHKAGRQPFIISGPSSTKKSWRDEWVQITPEQIILEVRKEGDKAVVLEEQLRCEVVASAIVVVQEQYEEALPKLVNAFNCSTSRDLLKELGEHYFRPKVLLVFEGVVQAIISQLRYNELITDINCHELLQKAFANAVNAEMDRCGFRVVAVQIRFQPQKPAVHHPNYEILQRWLQQERRLRAMHVTEQIEKEKEEAQARAAKEKVRRDIEIADLADKAEWDKKKGEIERRAKEENSTNEKAIAKIQEDLDSFYHENQIKKMDYENDIKVREINDRTTLEKMSRDHEFNTKTVEFEYASKLHAMELASIEEQIGLAKHKSELERELGAIEQARGELEALLLEHKLRAEAIVATERHKFDGTLIQDILGKMPAIMQNMPVRNLGSTTVFKFGDGAEDQDASAILGALGVSVVSKIREVLLPVANAMGQTNEVMDTPDRPVQQGH